MTDPNRLIDAYLDGTLSKQQRDQLEQDLATNPQYADAFAYAMMINELLGQRFEHESIATTLQLDDGSFLGDADLKHLQDDYDHAQPALVTLDGAKPIRIGRGKTKREDHLSFAESLSAIGYGIKCLVRAKPAPFITTAIAALLLIALWLINPFAGNAPQDFTNNTPSQNKPAESAQPILRDQPIATLTNTHNATWAGSPAERALARGSALKAGTHLTLTTGFAEITTARGAVAILQAPATLELLNNDNAIRLHTGKLVGICETESSKGFLVRTPHMEVIDLGTQFGVEVNDDRASTHVQVYRGEVRAQTLASETPGDHAMTLRAGQAAQAGRQAALSVAAFDPLRFTKDPDDPDALARANAGRLFIENASFEAIQVKDGALTRGQVPGWVQSPAGSGVVANPGPGNADYYTSDDALDANGGSVGTMDGRCAFFFGMEHADATLTQTLNTPARVGSTYTLTVAIGNRSNNARYRPQFAGYTIELLAGDRVIASAAATPDQAPPKGTFTDITLTYTVQRGDPTGPLGIRLSTHKTQPHQVTDFDNIRLTATQADDEAARN